MLLAPGDAVAFATPAYPPFLAELPQAAPRLRELPLRRGRLRSTSKRWSARSPTASACSCSRTRTTRPGRVLPRAELEAIADRCAAHDAWVLADEIHAPLVLAGAQATPFLEVGESARECGIALTSASKAFNLAGLKAAVAVTASTRARAAVARLPDLADRCGLLGVVAAEAAFTDGDPWLDAVLDRLAGNRTLLGELVARELPGVEWTPPQASYLAWLDCRGLGLGDDPAAHFLARGRVALSPGLDYGSSGAGFVRLNFGTSPELVAELVRRMAAALSPA